MYWNRTQSPFSQLLAIQFVVLEFNVADPDLELRGGGGGEGTFSGFVYA